MNKCSFCGSEDIAIITEESKITEVCDMCGKSVTYDRIKVGKKGIQTYIETINYAFKLAKQPKVMVAAAGKRRLTLLNTLYALNSNTIVLEWKQQQTELGGLELSVILKEMKG